jgi:ParB family chromosome partitioning protein
MPEPTPPAAETRALALSDIAVPERLRPVDAAWVELLAASMQSTGLKQAIVVRPDPAERGRYLLVAGAHRHAAAVKLGWATIPAVVEPLDDLNARLVEIDENLARRELSALDRAVFLAERKRVYEALHPETRHGGVRRGSKKDQVANIGDLIEMAGLPRFTAATAEVLGLSERAVQRYVRLAKLLDAAEIAALRQSPLADNEAQLFAVAALPEADRQAVIGALGEGATSIAAALAAIGKGPAPGSEGERLFRAMVTAWSRADARTRKRVLAAIGAVMAGGGRA